MTTNRILRLLPMAAMCLLFTSCMDSKVPLSDPSKSKADERLAGNWQLRNDDGSMNSYRVALAGGKLPASVMRVTGSGRKPHGTTEQFEPLLLFPTATGDKTYLNCSYPVDRGRGLAFDFVFAAAQHRVNCGRMPPRIHPGRAPPTRSTT
jgi:hypothetical protein